MLTSYKRFIAARQAWSRMNPGRDQSAWLSLPAIESPEPDVPKAEGMAGRVLDDLAASLSDFTPDALRAWLIDLRVRGALSPGTERILLRILRQRRSAGEGLREVGQDIAVLLAHTHFLGLAEDAQSRLLEGWHRLMARDVLRRASLIILGSAAMPTLDPADQGRLIGILNGPTFDRELPPGRDVAVQQAWDKERWQAAAVVQQAGLEGGIQAVREFLREPTRRLVVLTSLVGPHTAVVAGMGWGEALISYGRWPILVETGMPLGRVESPDSLVSGVHPEREEYAGQPYEEREYAISVRDAAFIIESLERHFPVNTSAGQRVVCGVEGLAWLRAGGFRAFMNGLIAAIGRDRAEQGACGRRSGPLALLLERWTPPPMPAPAAAPELPAEPTVPDDAVTAEQTAA